MGRTPSGKTTSFDIAYRAGVSQPTVSRALRGDKAVSPATRQRIEAIARELHYSVDKNASSLRSQRSNTIALLFFEDPTPDESMINPFFTAILGSIVRACAQEGLDLLISFQRMEDDWHMRYHDSHRADGLILLGYGDYQTYEHRLHQLQRQGTHFVRFGSIGMQTVGITVGSDNSSAGAVAGRHLLSLSRRRIAFLGHADGHYPEFADRYRGLCMALAEQGIVHNPLLQQDALTTEAEGYRAARALLAHGERFDAIFAGSDLIAIGALRALAEIGRRVPADVAVVGFDDIAAASLTTPPLTTIMQDTKAAGALLVQSLIAEIEGTPQPDLTLPTRLIVRASTSG